MGVKNCSKPRKSIITHPWGHIKWKESFSWKFGFRFFYVAMLCVLLPHLENWASRTWEYVVKNGPMVIIVLNVPKKTWIFVGSPTPNWWDLLLDPSPGILPWLHRNQPLENPYHPTPRCWFHGTSKTLQMCLGSLGMPFCGNPIFLGGTTQKRVELRNIQVEDGFASSLLGKSSVKYFGKWWWTMVMNPMIPSKTSTWTNHR